MKAHNINLHDTLDINQSTGILKMNNKRMALMSVEAIGILRRDLVDTLSMERAKGFLMRYGWACGYKAGEDIESNYNWDSLEELMFAGARMHTLEGIVTVEPDKIDVGSHSLYFTGYWRNSFEVEEHIHHYGESKDPVCWILVGYASGYLTKVFGDQIIAYEDKCRGKGDAYCYFVAQTIDRDNPQHQELLRYYNADSLLTELDRSYQEIKVLNQNIIESQEVQKRLNDLFLANESTKKLIEEIAQTLNKSIILEHYYGENEAVFLHEDEEIHKTWHEEINNLKEKNNLTTVFPIHANGKNLGNLIMIKDNINQKDDIIIERCIAVLSIKIFHQLQLAQLKWEKKEDFFEELLNKEIDEETIQKGSHLLNVDIMNISRILVLTLEHQEKNQKILDRIRYKYPLLDVFCKDHRIVILLPQDYTDNLEIFTTNLQKVVKEKYENEKIHVGIGRKTIGIKRLAKSYQDALRICDFIKLTHPNRSRVSFFEELEPILIFLKGTDQEELIEFCETVIGELIQYDQENQSNLLVTLTSYLEYNGNLQHTADDLNLSIAGLRYRLDKIDSLSSDNLRTGDGRFKFQLALNIYFALKIVNKNTII